MSMCNSVNKNASNMPFNARIVYDTSLQTTKCNNVLLFYTRNDSDRCTGTKKLYTRDGWRK